MANVIVGGFRLYGTLSGGPIPTELIAPVANNYGTQINVGDLIIPVSDGTVAQAATNSSTMLGVVTGCSYTAPSGIDTGKRVYANFIPANTTFSPSTVGSPAESLVAYVPLTGDVVLQAQGAAATATTAATNITFFQNNVNITYNSLTPSTTIGRSVACLDLSGAGTGAKPIRIIGAPWYTLAGIDAAQVDFTSAGVSFLCVCNQGALPPFTTTGT